MIQYKYIAEYKKEEIDNLNVISCINQDGFNTILIKNSLKKSVVTTLNTDNLSVKLNSQLLLNNENYYFHIISSKNNDYINKTKFDVIYEYIFSKMTSPVTDTELAVLINSLEELFKITPEKDTFKMQVGVFGELLVIKELYKNGYIKILEKLILDIYKSLKFFPKPIQTFGPNICGSFVIWFVFINNIFG
jgi:hypothetical protein